jgi:hypothetical protein
MKRGISKDSKILVSTKEEAEVVIEVANEVVGITTTESQGTSLLHKVKGLNMSSLMNNSHYNPSRNLLMKWPRLHHR